MNMTFHFRKKIERKCQKFQKNCFPLSHHSSKSSFSFLWHWFTWDYCKYIFNFRLFLKQELPMRIWPVLLKFVETDIQWISHWTKKSWGPDERLNQGTARWPDTRKIFGVSHSHWPGSPGEVYQRWSKKAGHPKVRIRR